MGSVTRRGSALDSAHCPPASLALIAALVSTVVVSWPTRSLANERHVACSYETATLAPGTFELKP